jgi:uncharacterized membrane protein YfcA
LTAPFFLMRGLTGAAYIGTEAAAALGLHLTKIGVYRATDLLSSRVLLLGLALTPTTVLGAWLGKRVADRLSPQVFVALVEAGLTVGAVALFL